MGWVVNAIPRPLYARQWDPLPILVEAGWVPGPFWTGPENLASTWVRSPDRLSLWICVCLWSSRLFIETKKLCAQIFKRRCTTLRALILYIPIQPQALHFTHKNNLLLEFCQYTILRSIFYGVQTFAKLRPYISVIWTLWSLLEIGYCNGSIRAKSCFWQIILTKSLRNERIQFCLLLYSQPN